jgi:ATP-dependent exoDNAse (exonuclease V) beta subunit
MYEVKKITCNISKQFKDINDYAELCSELKLLYTAITRPKKTLIIYDDG